MAFPPFFLKAHIESDINNEISLFVFQQVSHQQLACTRNVCMSSIMYGANFPMVTNEARKPDVILEHAKDFIDQYFTSIRR